jgi:hypothetical protein
VLILVPLYQSTLPPLFFTLFCSFSFNQSSSAFLPILQRSSSITSPQPRLSNSIYLVFFPPPSSTPPFLSTTGWPEDPHRNARTFPTTPLDLPTLSLSSTVLLLRPRLLPNLIWSHHPPWWAARTLCAAALRQTSRCQLHTPPPPTALARPRRASVYMPASIPVATRYALVDPIMRASKADPQFAI